VEAGTRQIQAIERDVRNEATPETVFAVTPPGSSTVEITLTADGDSTIVRLVHRDLPTAESAEAHGHGWDEYMPRLAIAAAGGDAGGDPNRNPKEI
jgi:hypothetical protein